MSEQPLEKALADVKVGDVVYRYFGDDINPMELTVDRIDNKEIQCGQWDFDRVTGEELDDFFDSEGSEEAKTCLSYIRAEKR